ncbi:hypothetical protein SDC9_135061 [bioreactor metagenome]|uniref:Uncharacterized protein n=1 Tax=bioreactor metagenome TaxID=1076179 RepID=A0A645DEQ4_9ZZZZ
MHIGGRFARITQAWALLDASVIDGRATQMGVQRARPGSLAPATIGARMVAGIAPHDPPGFCRTAAHGGSQRAGDHPGQPGREVGDGVVQFRRSLAEAFVARVPVADHGIQGVDAPMDEQPGDSCDRTPEQ